MIKVENLQKSYNGRVVLDIESLHIRGGESFGLVGNNGAGKTTLFSLIMDLRRPERGRVLSKGINVAESEQWKSYTGAYIDEHFLIGFLRPWEYFKFIGKLGDLTTSEIRRRYQNFEDLLGFESGNGIKYIRELSKGNQKKVGIAGAMLNNPEIIVLDEPFSNLDPTSQIRVKKWLRDLHANSNTTMLISSHDLNHVTEVCDRIVVLENGKIKHDLETGDRTLSDLEEYFSVEK